MPKIKQENVNDLTLIGHLSELRGRLLFSFGFLCVAFIGCYVFAEPIYQFLVTPLADIYSGMDGKRLIFTGLTEAFFTYVKVAFYTALFISFPVFATQAYIFLAPGLYKKERGVLLPFLVACPVLFLMGAALVYYYIFPLAWSFFLSFEHSGVTGGLPIQLEAKISEYLSLVIQLVFAFGIAFQLPVLLMLLTKVGFTNSDALKLKRKYAIIAIVTIAAILTPPDIISQIGLAFALMLLYECSIFACKWMEPGKNHA